MLAAALIAAALSGGVPAPIPPGTPVELGIKEVANAVANSATVTTVADAPAGHTVFVPVVTTGDTVISSISDSEGNTYTPTSNYTGGGSGNVIKGFWCTLTTLLPTGSTITVQFSSTNGRKFVAAYCSSGITGIDFTGTGSTGTSTTPALTTAALAQANSQAWAIVYLGAGYADTYDHPAGWTPHTPVITETRVMRVAHINPASAAAIAYSGLNTVSRTWTMNIVVFKGN